MSFGFCCLRRKSGMREYHLKSTECNSNNKKKMSVGSEWSKNYITADQSTNSGFHRWKLNGESILMCTGNKYIINYLLCIWNYGNSVYKRLSYCNSDAALGLGDFQHYATYASQDFDFQPKSIFQRDFCPNSGTSHIWGLVSYFRPSGRMASFNSG